MHMSLSVGEVVVRMRRGQLRGQVVDGVASFKGVPYAAPPFGVNRFRPPQPAVPWSGVRDALDYGPTVPKPPYAPPFADILAEPAIAGDECLNLNVWTPDAGAAGLPVLVWIHGGSFVNGSGAVPSYDGARFARDGVVCVTINYRLGVDGFLFLDDGVANLGLLDQVAALRWVHENIAAFGGDPGRVTIAGESAGGMSVTALLSMPRAEGLFRRAIAQSGAGHHALTPETARLVGGYLAEKLGVEATRDAIAQVPLERLVEAQFALCAEPFVAPDPARWREIALNSMAFEPVTDGDVLPALPIDCVATGAGAGVDLLLGSNTEEHRFFLVPTGAVDVADEQFLAALAAGYGLPENAIDLYRSARPGAIAGDVLAAVATDWFFRIPAVRLAEAHSKGGAANHVYEFAWRSPQFDGRLGAGHVVEIAFAFDNLHEETSEPLHGAGPPQALADEMHGAWVAFATSGDPGWPRYEPSRRAVMRFDTPSALVEDPARDERLVWEGLR
jgi:para-nitrobenzyl esterase